MSENLSLSSMFVFIHKKHIPVLKHIISIFGILKNMRWLFVLTTLIMIVILYVWFNKSYFKNEFMRFGIVIVIAGAIGNLIDRLIYGYVVDFIDFYLINFPVFNIADCLVCIGAGMLLIHYIFLEKEKKDVKS